MIQDDDAEDLARNRNEARERIARTRAEIDMFRMKLLWDKGVREMHTHQAWKDQVARVEAYRQQQLEAMAVRKMDAYELGKVQGKLYALRAMCQLQPMPLEQLDETERHVNNLEQVLSDQLEYERNLMR